MPSKPPSVFDEPQFSNDTSSSRPNESPISSLSSKEEESVWDEPGLSPELLADSFPKERVFQRRMLKDQEASPSFAWILTLVLAICSGLWAILGALFLEFQKFGVGGLPMLILIAPLAEEMMKISAPLMLLEKRPALFRSPIQILFCGGVAGVIFALIENQIYFKIYLSSPSASLIHWRQTVCVAMHTGCALIASLGLIQVWKQSMKDSRPAQGSLGTPYYLVATLIHGGYNLIALWINPVFSVH